MVLSLSRVQPPASRPARGRVRSWGVHRARHVAGMPARRVPELLAVLFFGLYTALSLRLHARHETTAYDLGIFEQGLRGYAEGGRPVSHLRGLNLLGDHFSPVMALLVPAYRVFPDARTLLVAQAALLAVSVLPLARLAGHWFGTATATAVGLAYGLAWGLQQAVSFDVHEICFAVPLLAFAATALARRRPGAAVAWSLPLLLVKEDLFATVVVVGLLVAVQGRRRLGLWTAAAALAAGAAVLLVVLPLLNPQGRYEYAGGLHALAAGSGLGLLAVVKLQTVLWVLAPTAFVALRSPLVLLAVPTLAWRFAAGNPHYWGTGFHYSAVLVPVVFAALLDGLRRATAGRPRARRAGPPLVAALCLAGALVASAGQPLQRLTDPAFWRDPPWVAAQDRALALVPDGAVVAATNGLAPQLTSRADVWMFPLHPDAPPPDYVVADVAGDTWREPLEVLLPALADLRRQGWGTVLDDAGTVVLRRGLGPSSSP